MAKLQLATIANKPSPLPTPIPTPNRRYPHRYPLQITTLRIPSIRRWFDFRWPFAVLTVTKTQPHRRDSSLASDRENSFASPLPKPSFSSRRLQINRRRCRRHRLPSDAIATIQLPNASGDASTSGHPSHSLLSQKPSVTITTVRSLQIATGIFFFFPFELIFFVNFCF